MKETRTELVKRVVAENRERDVDIAMDAMTIKCDQPRTWPDLYFPSPIEGARHRLMLELMDIANEEKE